MRRGSYGHELWHAGDRDPSVILTGGASRVVVDDPAPEGWKPNPIGFRPPPVEVEPQLWDGDQA